MSCIISATPGRGACWSPVPAFDCAGAPRQSCQGSTGVQRERLVRGDL